MLSDAVTGARRIGDDMLSDDGFCGLMLSLVADGRGRRRRRLSLRARRAESCAVVVLGVRSRMLSAPTGIAICDAVASMMLLDAVALSAMNATMAMTIYR